MSEWSTSLPVAPAVSGMGGTQSPGMEIEFNHDLNLPDEFLNGYPMIRSLLKDDRLLNRFNDYDGQAKSHKKSFHRLGLWSLTLALLSLGAAAVRLLVSEETFSHYPVIAMAAEFAGVLSVVFVLWGRWKGHRAKWCVALFLRERLRQWHFQMFLDGRLMDLFLTKPDMFESELDARWHDLQQNFRDGSGMMNAFVRSATHQGDFFHEPSDFTNDSLAESVLRALWILRVEHQLRFSRRKTAPGGEGASLALQERTSWSETVASTSLAAAVVVCAMAFVVSLFHFWPVGGHGAAWATVQLSRELAGSALALAVLSAASRAYRAGYTLPDESESYEEYCDRIRELQAGLKSVPEDREKLKKLVQLEEEAAAELRRFLRMKLRATFIF